MTSGECEIFEEYKEFLGYSINLNIENFLIRNLPRRYQNVSEASSPQKNLECSYPMLQECHSRSSSCRPSSPCSCSSTCNFNNFNSQDAQSFLAQAAEGKLRLAYEGCRELVEEVHRHSKNKKKRLFYDLVHPALQYNQNYQTRDAWSFISKAKELRDSLQLDDQAANAVDLFYNYIRGRFCMLQKEFQESFEAFEKAAEILRRKQNGDPKEAFYIKNNLAKLYYTSEEKNYQEAERLLREGLQYSNQNNDHEHKALCHFQLTELYIIQKDIRQAQENWKLSLDAAKKITALEQRLLFNARNLRNEGDLSFILGEKEKAIHRYETALGLLDRILPPGNILNERYFHELEVYRDEPGVSEITLEFSDT